jgi:alpha-tubulin suppressor-like RCC1 family protein
MTRLFSRIAKPLAIVLACTANVAATTTASAAYTTVLSFGSNGHGRTGQGTRDGLTLAAKPVDWSNLGNSRITQVAAGGLHSLLLTENGSVFSFGLNEEGELGLGWWRSSPYELVAKPIDTTKLDGRAITQLAAGRTHSLLLAEDGSVFSFGGNIEGQLGLGTITYSESSPTPIDASNMGGRAITQVAGGGDHSLLLAEDGSVFSFGPNANGQTGLGTTSGNTLVATPIDASNLGGRKITQVAAGGAHSLLLAEDGSVFSFGSNEFGQTGLGTSSGNQPLAMPIDASNLGGRKITQVAAGYSVSLLLAEDGSVFSFGANSLGRTGLETDSGNTLVATPIDASNLGGRKVTQVAAGGAHGLLLADDGSVFSFGSNIVGQTGLGTNKGNTLVATPIDPSNLGGRKITQIAAGGGHSLLLDLVPEPRSLALTGVAWLVLVRLPRRWR